MMIEITSEYLASQGLSQNFPKRFWEKVEKTDGCWYWTACTRKYGYGAINTGFKKMITATRASWILNYGPIPYGLDVCHNCPGGDNPSCVNPAHLWLGNEKDNLTDMSQRGRSCAAERCPTRKLNWESVDECRNLHRNGVSIYRIRQIFHISYGVAWRIIHGLTWRERDRH